MNQQLQIAANIAIAISIILTPWLEDMLKLYLICAVVIIAFTVNVAFRVKWLMDIIVEHLVQAVLQKVLRDQDIQKIMSWKFEEMRKKVEGKR